jgi:hypothetical protein
MTKVAIIWGWVREDEDRYGSFCKGKKAGNYWLRQLATEASIPCTTLCFFARSAGTVQDSGINKHGLLCKYTRQASQQQQRERKKESPIYALELSQKYDFQLLTIKPDNIAHPTNKTDKF